MPVTEADPENRKLFKVKENEEAKIGVQRSKFREFKSGSFFERSGTNMFIQNKVLKRSKFGKTGFVFRTVVVSHGVAV